MPTPEKIEQVNQIKEKLKEYDNFIVTDYRGLTVEQITKLRKKLMEHGVVYQVLKNNLVKIALKESNIEGVDEYLFGPTAIAFAKEDSVTPSKIIVDFTKEANKLKVRGAYSEGKAVNENAVIALSKLPSKEVLLSKLLGGLKSPLTCLANVLNGPVRNLAYALKQVSEKKQ